jgi:NADH dehydrogenase (ubiquinone) Fe-S protein 6
MPVSARAMSIPPPEVSKVTTTRVWCDGATDIRSGANYRPAALGHPKVWLEIDEHGYVDCCYCDRRFVLVGGPADGADHGALRDIASGAS